MTLSQQAAIPCERIASSISAAVHGPYPLTRQMSRASVAQSKADHAARRPKTSKLVTNARLHAYVQERLSGQVRRPDGTAVFPKGRTAEAELTAAGADWTMSNECFESRTEPGATILRITGIRRVGP